MFKRHDRSPRLDVNEVKMKRRIGFKIYENDFTEEWVLDVIDIKNKVLINREYYEDEHEAKEAMKDWNLAERGEQ